MPEHIKPVFYKVVSYLKSEVSACNHCAYMCMLRNGVMPYGSQNFTFYVAKPSGPFVLNFPLLNICSLGITKTCILNTMVQDQVTIIVKNFNDVFIRLFQHWQWLFKETSQRGPRICRPSSQPRRGTERRQAEEEVKRVMGEEPTSTIKTNCRLILKNR